MNETKHKTDKTNSDMADQEKTPKHKNIGQATQAFLKIAEIKDDTMILRDGTMRSVLAVSSTNFDLKSQDEQNALIFNYQRFLNSLEYPVQILMQSRKIDISDYLDSLKRIMERQTNELLRMQTAEYIEFIGRLVESANIMNKNFYVIIPYNQILAAPSTGGFFKNLFKGGQAHQITERQKSFDKYKVLLDDRTSSVSNNLSSIGLRVVRLTTEQIIELLYDSYNFAAGPTIDASQLDSVTILDDQLA